MSFSLQRLRTGDWIIAGATLLLFVALFFVHWYGGSINGLLKGSQLSGGTVESTGWEAFTASRWIWLATIIFGLGSVLASAVDYKLEGPLQLSAIVAGLGTLSSALIVFRIVHHPGASASAGTLHLSYGIKPGIWLGLVATLAVAAGGYLRAQGGEAPAREAPARPDEAEAFSGLTVAGADSPPASRPPDRAP